MRNYLQTGNNKDWGLNFWEDPFENFFKPVFFDEHRNGMRTDIKEKDGNYELSIDVPGFSKKDISVTLNNGYLTVEAKKSESEEGKNYLRRERSYSCSRSYYVGEDVERKDIKAKYDNGILSLTIPKKEEKEIGSGNIEIQ